MRAVVGATALIALGVRELQLDRVRVPALPVGQLAQTAHSFLSERLAYLRDVVARQTTELQTGKVLALRTRYVPFLPLPKATSLRA